MASALLDKVLDRVDIGDADDCWLWTGAKRPDGYGQFRINNRRDGNLNLRAHRIVLDLAGIPRADEFHHVCGNRLCVNPDHLQGVTKSEHSRITQGDVCKRGHPRTEENVYVRPDGRRSHCRQCQREGWPK